MADELFKGIVPWEYERQGVRFKKPDFYRRQFMMTTVHTAATGQVARLLPHPDMKPMQVLPGKCLVACTAFEYIDFDAGPYNEFSISILITFRERNIPMLTALRKMKNGNSPPTCGNSRSPLNWRVPAVWICTATPSFWPISGSGKARTRSLAASQTKPAPLFLCVATCCPCRAGRFPGTGVIPSWMIFRWSPPS